MPLGRRNRLAVDCNEDAAVVRICLTSTDPTSTGGRHNFPAILLVKGDS
jgi:hypothetical protein